MAKLTGERIRSEVAAGKILIDPFNLEQLGPNSYDLRLSKHLVVFPRVWDGSQTTLDMKVPGKGETFEMSEVGFVLQPNRLYLGSTTEKAGSDFYVPCIEGRSSVARLGLFVHITAGFGDVGFLNHWTLELVAVEPIRIYPGVKICQIYFDTVEGEITRYNGKYKEDDIKPRQSAMYKDFLGGDR